MKEQCPQPSNIKMKKKQQQQNNEDTHTFYLLKLAEMKRQRMNE